MSIFVVITIDPDLEAPVVPGKAPPAQIRTQWSNELAPGQVAQILQGAAASVIDMTKSQIVVPTLTVPPDLNTVQPPQPS